MSSPFRITVDSNTALLDSQNQWQTTFTVSNLGNKGLTCRANLFSQDSAVVSWLRIIGETELYLPISGIAQFVVNLTVPLLASPGSYSFHLNLVDVSNPDESFTQGPSVTFTVPPTKVNKRRWYLWALLIALGIILVITYIGIIMTTGR